MTTNNSFEHLIKLIQISSPQDFKNLDWNAISSFRFLSENFMETFKDNLNWSIVCTYQRLSEDFIRKLSNKVDYRVLSNTHASDLSLDFLFENKEKLNMKIIKNNKKIFKNKKLSVNYNGPRGVYDDDKIFSIKNTIKSKQKINDYFLYSQDYEFYHPYYNNFKFLLKRIKNKI